MIWIHRAVAAAFFFLTIGATPSSGYTITCPFDGVTNCTTDIQTALNADTAVELPEGTTIISGLSIVKNGQVLCGKGRHATKLIVNNATSIGININAGLAGVEVCRLTIGRNVTPTSGDGLSTLAGSTSQANIHDVLSTGHFRGFALGSTDWSVFRDNIAEKNIWDGIYGTNSASAGTWQWSLIHNLSQMNGARGLLVESSPGPSQLTMGTITQLDTFGNSGVDVAFVGSAYVPIEGVRMSGGFNGESGNHTLYFDTYGGMHKVSDFFIELTGRSPTGPTLSTPASNTGNGIYVSPNNKDIIFTGGIVAQSSLSGLFLSAGEQELVNIRSVNNGQSLVAGERAGIRHLAGKMQVIGGRSGNSAGLSTQQYGVHGYNAAKAKLIGLDLEANATASWLYTTGTGACTACFP